MSTEGDALYAKKLSLLTLKGRLEVHFIDGQMLQGEFVTQDEFNIFLMVDDKPAMIPRSQIRYILGKPGQPVEKDSSQEALLEPEPATAEPTPPPTTFPQTAQVEEAEDEDDQDRHEQRELRQRLSSLGAVASAHHSTSLNAIVCAISWNTCGRSVAEATS